MKVYGGNYMRVYEGIRRYTKVYGGIWQGIWGYMRYVRCAGCAGVCAGGGGRINAFRALPPARYENSTSSQLLSHRSMKYSICHKTLTFNTLCYFRRSTNPLAPAEWAMRLRRWDLFLYSEFTPASYALHGAVLCRVSKIL